MKSLVVLGVVLFCIHAASAGTHSYQYIYTAVSGIPQFPEFSVVGTVDGEQINYYDSELKEVVPRQEWVKGAVDPDFWKRNTQIFSGTQPVFKNNIETVKQRFNQTGGVHTWQLMYGCELDEDGKTKGYFQYGYDGEDFISLDKSTLTWTAANQKAVITKVKWEATGDDARYWKGYLENTCIEWVKKYVGYGRETLERKVPPEVSVFQKNPSSPATCHVTGFFPKGVMVSWERDGQEVYEDMVLQEMMPNEDGTFQTRSTLRISPKDLEKHTYTCTVDHSSLKEKIVKSLNPATPGGPSNTDIIIGVVVAVLIVAAIGLGACFLLKKKGKAGFVPANTADDGSNSSSNTSPVP